MRRYPRRKFLEMGIASATLAGSGAGAGCAMPPRGPLPPNAKLGGSIEHFVVLMMENRSYDQMLGALPGEKYAGPPDGTILTYVDKHHSTLNVRGASPPRHPPETASRPA